MKLLQLRFILVKYAISILLALGFIKLGIFLLEKFSNYIDKKISYMAFLKESALRECGNFNSLYNKFLYSNPNIVEITNREEYIFSSFELNKIESLQKSIFYYRETEENFKKNQLKAYFNYLVEDGLILVYKEYLSNKIFYKKRFK